MPKNRIYIDVTQLVHWQGTVTGIPRVMNELAVRFAEEENVEFVSWVKDRQELCLVDFKTTQTNKLKGTGGLVYATSEPEGVASGAAPLREAHYKMKVRHLAKRIVRKLGVENLAVVDKIKNTAAKAESMNYIPVKPDPSATLLIPWGEWWDNGFTNRLISYQAQGLKIVQVIHDVGPIIWPQFFEKVEVNFEDYITKIVPVSSMVLNVSKNTEKELHELLKKNGLKAPVSRVFRLGEQIPTTKSTRPADAAFVRSKLKGNDYLLCVGTVEAKKNHALLYYTYKLAKARGIDLPKIVIVGRKGWNTENIVDIMSRDPEVKDKFVLTDSINDEELSWLFDNCMCTILPSFHEGWGIPIAESVARGIPCICSNTSSMVEIAEDYVTHFSPASSDECLAAIQDILEPGVLEKRKRDIKKYRPTSWDDTYRQVDAYIKEIL